MSGRLRRAVGGLLAVIVIGNLGLGAAVVGHHFARHEHHAPAAEPGARFRPVPDQQQAAEAARNAAVTALLAARANAIRHHNRAAFLATVDPASRAFRTQQARYFANLQHVPFASWSYVVDSSTTAPTDGSQFLKYAAPVWLPHVVLHYAIAGFDRTSTSLDTYFTFVQRDSRWYVGSDTDGGKLGYDTARDIWDFGPVSVVTGKRAIVLGHPTSAVSLRALLAEADRDVPRVNRVWGTGWSQRVVVLVPNTTSELSKLIGSDDDLSQIAAVATAEVVASGHRTTAVGDRILVNPRNYPRLSSAGRQVVVTHEITHVASRAATGPLVPTWLVEGIADYAGYLDLHVSPRVAAHALKVYLDGGHRVSALPADSAYSGKNKHLDVAYDESWLACRFVAEHWSQAALVRLYRAVGAIPHGSSTSATNSAMRTVLHEPLSAFTQQWRGYITSVLQ